MEVVKDTISNQKIKEMASRMFGNLVKAVVDVEKSIFVIDAELHSDEEAHLLQLGSKQEHLWGINIYPDLSESERIEFDSMINVRPSQGNNSREVEDPKIRESIIKIVSSKITK